MELRLVLAAVIVAGCGLCGRSMAWSAARRQRLIGEILDALRMLRVQIVSMLEPLDRALRQTEMPLFVSVADALAGAGGTSEAWKTVCTKECRRGALADCLEQGDRDVLDRLFEHLGESGRTAQDAAIRACIEALETIHAGARERAATTGRLYGTVGFLTGLAIAVLMI